MAVRSVAGRWRRVAGAFTDRASAVPPEAWENPSPCEGWTAREVVRHLVEWVPPFLASGSDVVVPDGPPVDEDPAGAWQHLSSHIQGVLDSPDIGERVFADERAGEHPLDEAIGMFVLRDVLVHTWDLARAVGLDETLDEEAVIEALRGYRAMGALLEHGGHYRPPLPVPEDASEQQQLLALTGRNPF